MKKYLILLLPILFFGCEEIPEGEITNPVPSYQLTKITAPTEFVFSPVNKQFTAVLEFSSSGGIEEVKFDVYSPAGKKVRNSIIMKDDGDLKVGDIVADDGKFSGIFQFPDTTSNGQYKIYFYVQDDRQTINAALHFLQLSNFENAVPVISDLVMPDSVAAGASFTFTLKAADSNGMDDIELVYFWFMGATGEMGGAMHDDGNQNFGDQKSGDGVYSYKSFFTEEAKGQERIFTFQARDRGKALSNTIIHKIYVK